MTKLTAWWTRRARSRLGVVALGFVSLCGACKNDTPPANNDAGLDVQGPTDLATDVPPTPQILDFTVVGCPLFDGSKPQCRGPAPLTVSFAPITAGNVPRLLWDFGDGPPTSEPFPTHTYALPGKYTVTLLGPDISSPRKADFIEVTENPLGGACDVNPQCEAGLSCLCGQSETQCPAAFSRGVCALSCAMATCPEGSVCADLGHGLAASIPNKPAWRAPHCLRACVGDEACAPGQRCRAVPVAGATPARWDRACFFAFPGEPGAPCRAPEGNPQDDLCLGGRCADLGAQGVCSADCTQFPCAAGTACTTFNDGRKLCLRRCGPATPCSDDPLLACTSAGGMGPLGFTFAPEEPPTTAVCGAKRCTQASDCGPAGTCMAPPAGHCIRRVPTP